MRRRVVVTGAAGFLGAALVHRLVGDGHEVLASTRPGGDAWRLADLPALPRLALDVAGLEDGPGRRAAEEAFARFRPDVLVHAAWRGVRGADRDDPAQSANVAPALALFTLAAAAGARRFVGLGSQAEYGPGDGPLGEDAPARPTTAYGRAKLACGERWLALARRSGVSAAWVRVFSVYGPGQREGALVPDLARALAAARSLPLGPGDAAWDYLYEDDAAEALAALVVRDDARGVFNLASGTSVPLRDVMRRVADLVAPGTELALGSRTAPAGEPHGLQADVARLAAATGWRAPTGLDEGLARTVAAALGPAPAAGRAGR